jgi:hypothetical protein
MEALMLLTLTQDQGSELAGVLAETLKEMSHEIADTDNPRYRAGLVARRRTMQDIAAAIAAGLASSEPDGRHALPR